jgi:hypothetical protein
MQRRQSGVDEGPQVLADRLTTIPLRITETAPGELASLARAHNYSLMWGGSGKPELDADPRPQHAEELCH